MYTFKATGTKKNTFNIQYINTDMNAFLTKCVTEWIFYSLFIKIIAYSFITSNTFTEYYSLDIHLEQELKVIKTKLCCYLFVCWFVGLFFWGKNSRVQL